MRKSREFVALGKELDSEYNDIRTRIIQITQTTDELQTQIRLFLSLSCLEKKKIRLRTHH